MPYQVIRNGEQVAVLRDYNAASYFRRKKPKRRDGTDIWKIVRTGNGEGKGDQ